MKLVRCGLSGAEKPGLLVDGRRVDVSSLVRDYDEEFFASEGLASLSRADLKGLPEFDASMRLGPCIARPSKILCVGLNYHSHAAETGSTPPSEPILFMKSTTSLAGPNDDVVIPRGSTKTDYEVELLVVMGRRASYVEVEEAMDYVAGYALHNDYSEREYQLERQGTWDKGKGCDTFSPIGPFLATKDEIADPNALRLWLSVNGEMRQDSNTSYLIFNIPFLISYISQFMTLLPGDVISTGTPQGVALGMKPPRYLKPGDIVELGIDGLGSAKQRLVEWRR